MVLPLVGILVGAQQAAHVGEVLRVGGLAGGGPGQDLGQEVDDHLVHLGGQAEVRVHGEGGGTPPALDALGAAGRAGALLPVGLEAMDGVLAL